jgi:hypothetical protein
MFEISGVSEISDAVGSARQRVHSQAQPRDGMTGPRLVVGVTLMA